jgi:hypothetical protein
MVLVDTSVWIRSRASRVPDTIGRELAQLDV